MIILKFEVNEQNLKRIDIKNIVAQAKNELYAEFELDSIWTEIQPITAQFKNRDAVVDVFVENGQCLIPWEVLQERGTLSVCLIGGDLLTTNTVDVSVLNTGVIGGLVPTKASPSVYSYIVELANNIKDSVSRFLKGDFSDVDILADSLEAEKIKTTEIATDTKSTSTYSSIKNKLKFGNSGFDISVESTKTNGEVYKNQIKTSNSKLTINAADYAVNSEKNEKHNIKGNYELLAIDWIRFKYGNNTAYEVNGSHNGLYYIGSKIEINGYDIELEAPGADLKFNSKNHRQVIGGSGAYEVETKGSGNIIRLLNYNTNEDKTVKLYLGEDNAIIGVDGESSESSSSDITAGIEVGTNGVEIKGNDVLVNGRPIQDKIHSFASIPITEIWGDGWNDEYYYKLSTALSSGCRHLYPGNNDAAHSAYAQLEITELVNSQTEDLYIDGKYFNLFDSDFISEYKISIAMAACSSAPFQITLPAGVKWYNDITPSADDISSEPWSPTIIDITIKNNVARFEIW